MNVGKHNLAERTKILKPWLVTGATGGVGGAAAFELTKRGAPLVVVGRNVPALMDLSADLTVKLGCPEASVVEADLSTLTGIRDLAATLTSSGVELAGIVHGAGIFPWKYELNPDGIERSWMINYLAPFMLDHLLRSVLSPGSRILLVAGAPLGLKHLPKGFNTKGLTVEDWSPIRAALSAAAAKCLHVRDLAEDLLPLGGYAFGFHPGAVPTRMAQSAPAPVRIGASFISCFFRKRCPIIPFLAFESQSEALTGKLVSGTRGYDYPIVHRSILAKDLKSDSFSISGLEQQPTNNQKP